MDELGHILREARETRGLTLSEVQEQTRIGTRFLDALETGQYELLPTPVHVRGFLRNYARFLGLDPEPLLNRYALIENERPFPTTSQPETTMPITQPLQPRIDQPFFDPVNMEVNDSRQRDPESALRLVIIGALIVALILAASNFIPLFLGNQDTNEAFVDEISGALEGIINNEVEPAASDITITTPNASEIITSTSRNNFETELPSPAPTRPPLPATLETIQLRLEITERAWMQVTIDGDIVFSGLARKGDEPYEWEAQEEATVATGNAIGIFITINDIPLGRMGENRGEAKEETWRTTQ